MRCPTCGHKMRYNKHGAYYHCCGWQIIIVDEKELNIRMLRERTQHLG
jgi:hypothetical protein